MISGNSHYCVTEALGSEKKKNTRRTCNKIGFQMLKLSFSARKTPRNYTQRRTCTPSSYANVEVENIHWKEVSAAAQNIQTLNQFRGFAVGLSIEQCIIIFLRVFEKNTHSFWDIPPRRRYDLPLLSLNKGATCCKTALFVMAL